MPAAQKLEFCSVRGLFSLIAAGVSLAFVVALSSAGDLSAFSLQFGLGTLFVAWVILTAVPLICFLARRFDSRPWRAWLAISGLLLLPAITAIYSVLVVWIFPDWAIEFSATWFVIRNTAIAAVATAMLFRYVVLQQRWRSQTEAEARARLDALQARIRPHFLFNALNAIAELIHEQPDAAEEALLDLSDLLRIGLGTEVRHSLSEELALIRGYLRIEALRLGDKLRVEWVLPERLPDELQLPPLVLQPLVENAVIHGVAARADGGELLIRAQRISFRRLRFEIENPMPGARESADRPGHGTALENIRQRLALAYEERASLKTWEHDGKFHAALTLPLDQ